VSFINLRLQGSGLGEDLSARVKNSKISKVRVYPLHYFRVKQSIMTPQKITLAISLLASMTMLTAFVWKSKESSTEEDIAQLKIINARFIHNYVTNDVASHEKIIHPQFVHISSKGKWVDRAQYLLNWKTGFDPTVILYWDYRSEKITVIGTTALVRSVNKFTILENGKETTAMSQYTDTYVKENGTWRCIQAQITNIAPENYPGDETIVKKYVKGKMS
jgi:ketosteroid isomerase-like protein